MPQTNFTFLEQFIQTSKGSDWVNNIPELTRDNVTEVGNAILNYQPAKESFFNNFIVKITLQLFDGMVADNKFKHLKMNNVVGNIEDSYVDYIKGENYDPESEELLKKAIANIKTLYHQEDRRLKYKTSISDEQVRKAMLSTNGLSQLNATILATLTNSAEFDEFTMVKELLLANFENRGKVVVVDEENNKDRASATLYEIKKHSARMTYVSSEYNKMGVKNATSLNNQLVVLHEDVKLDMDFGTFADIYNIDKISIGEKVITVDNFNEGEVTVDGTTYDLLAIIVDKRAFRIADTLRQMETFRNPDTLTTTYFLHIWQLMSMAFFHNMLYIVAPQEAKE